MCPSRLASVRSSACVQIQHNVAEQWRQRTSPGNSFIRIHQHAVRHQHLGFEQASNEYEDLPVLVGDYGNSGVVDMAELVGSYCIVAGMDYDPRG